MAGYSSLKTKHLLGIVAAFSCLLSVDGAFAVEACESLPEPQPAMQTLAYVREGRVDYVAINRILQLTDDAERRQHLRAQISAITAGRQYEATALLPRLQIALAHSELRLGNPEAAVLALRQVPLESAQAASALVLLGEATRLADSTDKAGTWILHAAQLYPHQPETVEGLLLAASWQSSPANALPFLRQAKSLADAQLDAVTTLLQQVNAPDFPNSPVLDKPDAALWSLAHEALTDPAFAMAQQQHRESQAFRDCLQAHMLALAAHRERNPTLIRDLGQALQQLDVLLPVARNELPRMETGFMETAHAFKVCQQGNANCEELQRRRDRQGRELTQLRNRLQIMEQQRRFLTSEQQKLLSRWQAEQKDMAALGMAVMQKKSESRQIMAELLLATLTKSLERWQDLSARVHFRLATTQESLLLKAREDINLP